MEHVWSTTVSFAGAALPSPPSLFIGMHHKPRYIRPASGGTIISSRASALMWAQNGSGRRRYVGQLNGGVLRNMAAARLVIRIALDGE